MELLLGREDPPVVLSHRLSDNLDNLKNAHLNFHPSQIVMKGDVTKRPTQGNIYLSFPHCLGRTQVPQNRLWNPTDLAVNPYLWPISTG
jgi:hypothetical protein